MRMFGRGFSLVESCEEEEVKYNGDVHLAGKIATYYLRHSDMTL